MPSAQTIEEAIRGDGKAFATIVEDFRDMVWRICFRLLGDNAEAEDVVQLTFIRAWRSLPGYNPKYSMATWLGTIAGRLCHDVLRKRDRRRRYEQEGLRTCTEEDIGPESDMATREIEAALQRATQTLSPMQKTVFVLHEIEQLPQKDISDITGWTSVQIRTNLYFARKKVREYLEHSDIRY